jgi:hypothetical protein
MKEIKSRIDETGKTNDSDTTCQRDRHHKILQETYRLLLDKYLMNPLTVTAYALLQSNSFSNSSYHLDLNGYSFDADKYTSSLANRLMIPLSIDGESRMDCKCGYLSENPRNPTTQHLFLNCLMHTIVSVYGDIPYIRIITL